MQLQPGQIFKLNNASYEVRKLLGQGAAGDVYLAVLQGAPAPGEVAIKLVQDQYAPGTFQAEGAHTEAEVLTALNRAEDRRWANLEGPIARYRHAHQTLSECQVIRLLDVGLDRDRRMALVQELAPAAIERRDIKQIDDERAIIGVVEAIARTIELAHAQGFALKDFEPQGGKGDRIRVDWAHSANIKLIDWNATAGPNATPEEKASNLFDLGGHLFYLLTGLYAPRESQLPIEPGVNLPGWFRLTEGSRAIVRRLLYRRYQSARELHDDLSWWLGTLTLKTPGDLERRLRLTSERAERKLAVADLALRLAVELPAVGRFELAAAERERFEQALDQARRDLDRADRLLIDQGVLNLRTGLYRKAIEEFERYLNDPQLPLDIKRQTRIYLLQARVGAWLREQLQGANLANNAVWQLVGQAADALRRQQWTAALDNLGAAQARFNNVDAEHPLALLQVLANAGLVAGKISELHNQAHGGPRSVAAFHQWLKEERERNQQLDQFAKQLAPLSKNLIVAEPSYDTYTREAQRQIAQHATTIAQYEQIERMLLQIAAQREKADRLLTQATLIHLQTSDEHNPIAAYTLAEGQLAAAIADAKKIDDAQAAELIAGIQAQLTEVQTIQQSLDALPAILDQLRAGEYEQALARARQAYACVPHYEPARAIDALAQQATQRHEQAEIALDLAREALRQRRFDEAQDQLQQARAIDGQPLGGDAEYTLLGVAPGDLNLQLRDRDEAERLDRNIKRLTDLRQQTLHNRSKSHERVVKNIEAIRSELAPDGYGLNDDELARLEAARRGMQRISDAQKLLKSLEAGSNDNPIDRSAALRQVQAELAGDTTEQAQDLREQAAGAWLNLCEQESDLSTSYRLLEEGAELFHETALAHTLRDLLQQAKPAARIEERLSAEQQTSPTWLDSDRRLDILTQIERDLAQLASATTPARIRAVRQAPTRWDQQLNAALDALLQQTYIEACKLAHDHQFAASRRLLEQTWRTIPPTAYPRVPALQRLFQELGDALAQRLGIEAMLVVLIQEVKDGVRDFAKALKTFPALPEPHPQVELGDLVDLRQGFEELVRLKNQDETGRAPSIAQRLHVLYTRHAAMMLIKEGISKFAPAKELAAQIDALGEQATRQAINLADQVAASLVALDFRDDTSAHTLVTLFWTFEWWRATTAQRHPHASIRAAEALERMRTALRDEARRVQDEFLQHSSREQFELAQQAITRLREWNVRLTSRPAEVLLPSDLLLGDLTPVFDRVALDDWLITGKWFMRLVAPPDDKQMPDGYNASQLIEVRIQLNEVRRRLKNLREKIWPVLLPNLDASDATIKTIDDEADGLITLIDEFQQAYAKREAPYTLEALSDLFQSRERMHALPKNPILNRVSDIVAKNYRALENNLVYLLDQRVFAIIDMEDATSAAQILYAELLDKCRSKELKQTLDQAIDRVYKQPSARSILKFGQATYHQEYQRRAIVKQAKDAQRHDQAVAASNS